MDTKDIILELRTKLGFSQEDLAEKMFVSRQTVSSWETDRSRPDVDTLKTLADVFGTDVNDLIYGSPKGSYQRFQLKFLNAVIICMIILVIMGIIRGIILPNWFEVRGRKYIVGPSNLVLPLISEAIIFFVAGYLNTSFVSLWVDCRSRKAKHTLLIGTLLMLPSLLLILAFVLWYIFQDNPLSVRLFILFSIRKRWLRVPLFWAFPLVSGILLFLFFNKQQSKVTD